MAEPDASMKIIMIEKQRDKEKKQFEESIKKMKEDAEKGLVSIDAKFTGMSDWIEENIKASTVGLVTLEDFKKKKLSIELEEASNPLRRKEQSEPAKKRKTKIVKSKLSFGDEEENIEEEDGVENEDSQKKLKVGKNPFVETSFLPDKEREENERKAREQLAWEWMKKQDVLKNEPLIIDYGFCDGTGQRRTSKVLKGSSVGRFLDVVKQECKELRGVSVDSLMFIKDDYILPHHFSFYELHLGRVKGKGGGLLFNFDEDAKPKDELRLTKVVERRWYEQNKHMFPASKWEVYTSK